MKPKKISAVGEPTVIGYIKKVRCKNCVFAKHESSYNKTGIKKKNAWGSYCAKNGNHYSKYEVDKYTDEFLGARKKPSRKHNKNGDCKFYKPKWYIVLFGLD